MVLGHELVEPHFEVLEVVLFERFSLDLLREDVGPYSISFGEHESHLVEDVVDLFSL